METVLCLHPEHRLKRRHIETALKQQYRDRRMKGVRLTLTRDWSANDAIALRLTSGRAWNDSPTHDKVHA